MTTAEISSSVGKFSTTEAIFTVMLTVKEMGKKEGYGSEGVDRRRELCPVLLF